MPRKDGKHRRDLRRERGHCYYCKTGEEQPVFKGRACVAHLGSAETRNRAAALRRNYGITIKQYDAMHTAQNGLCAVCGLPETTKGGRFGTTTMGLAVDHDHATGEIRGLLCHMCNRAIGQFGDNAERMRLAASYIDRFAKIDPPKAPAS